MRYVVSVHIIAQDFSQVEETLLESRDVCFTDEEVSRVLHATAASIEAGDISLKED